MEFGSHFDAYVLDVGHELHYGMNTTLGFLMSSSHDVLFITMRDIVHF
jgi:hypothetical protein